MNQVSNIDLAIAVAKGGGFPSISIFNYYIGRNIVAWDRLHIDIQRYVSAVGNANFVLSFDTWHIISDHKPRFVDLLEKFKISHVELIGVDEHRRDSITRANLDRWLSHIQDLGTKIIVKAVIYTEDIDRWAFWDNGQRQVDALGFKGPGGAGRVMETSMTLDEMIKDCQHNYPTLPIIAVGGIADHNDVKRLMSLGILGVGVGTLFAAALESPVAVETKNKMIAANNEQLTKMQTDFLKQSALKFGDYQLPDNDNNTHSLRAGIKGSSQGHIFAGQGISGIKEILPAAEIIKRLFVDFDY